MSKIKYSFVVEVEVDEPLSNSVQRKIGRLIRRRVRGEDTYDYDTLRNWLGQSSVVRLKTLNNPIIEGINELIAKAFDEQRNCPSVDVDYYEGKIKAFTQVLMLLSESENDDDV